MGTQRGGSIANIFKEDKTKGSQVKTKRTYESHGRKAWPSWNLYLHSPLKIVVSLHCYNSFKRWTMLILLTISSQQYLQNKQVYVPNLDVAITKNESMNQKQVACTCVLVKLARKPTKRWMVIWWMRQSVIEHNWAQGLSLVWCLVWYLDKCACKQYKNIDKKNILIKPN